MHTHPGANWLRYLHICVVVGFFSLSFSLVVVILVDIIMWKFAFLVHLLIGIIVVVFTHCFCRCLLMPRILVFFSLWFANINNVKISREHNFKTVFSLLQITSLALWDLQSRCVFVSSFSQFLFPIFLAATNKCEFSHSRQHACMWISTFVQPTVNPYRARRILRNGMCQCK